MRHCPTILLLLVATPAIQAQGLLLPAERTQPPLTMVSHKVRITIDDQVSSTRVEQVFRNRGNRPLEATYVFPLPKGASLNRFTMWVDGKETTGELLEAAKAREIYTQIVRRTKDPGLLEYIDNNLLQMRVFPVPANGDQKVALEFTAVSPKEGGLVEYLYPLKADNRSNATLEDFSIEATIKSQHGVSNVYSPAHAITVKRTNDREVQVAFDRSQGSLERDFQLFYSTSDKDIGLTALTHRPVASEEGYFAFLISPRLEMAAKYRVPRDMVLVLDTSGSMRGAKMDQARRALKYCLDNLGQSDRFALINFATTVNKYRDSLCEVSSDRVADAKKWVEALEATGGTAIDDALAAALGFRSGDAGRALTIVFFTDGQPTIGETNFEKILHNVASKNAAGTRIFTFGVGDDVNATFLDQLADRTRAVSTYVRPAEDIEAKVSGLYTKISNPVLTDLKLSAEGVSLREVYPPVLPDLYQGSQLVVLGRYTGHGQVAINLTGRVAVAGETGIETRVLSYQVSFPERTGGERSFVEPLWARRKVGYMLDQIRSNGEKKELVDEVVILAKRYGIATPYTSYLVVPEGPMPLGRGVRGPQPREFLSPMKGVVGYGGVPLSAAAASARSVAEFAKAVNEKPGDLAGNRNAYSEHSLRLTPDEARMDKDGKAGAALEESRSKKAAYDSARLALAQRQQDAVQAGKLGVDLSVQTQNLRNQARLEQTASRNILGRNVVEIGGIWIDEGFNAKTPIQTVKAQGDAYFRILERQPTVKELFVLGNQFVWVTPAGVALIVDPADGAEKLSDDAIDRLFVAKSR